MRRRPAFLAALAVLCTVAIAHLPGNAGDDAPSEKLKVVVYPVSDLPVWKYASAIKTTSDADGIVRTTQDRPDGETKFDPSLLITVIKSSVDPQNWDKTGVIAPHEKTAALVIRATQANHEKIAELLEQLRVGATDEELSQADEFERQKAHALRAMSDARYEQMGGVDGAVVILDEALASLATSPLDPDRKKLIRGALSAHRKLLLRGDARKKQLTSYAQQRWPTPDEDLNRLDRYMQNLRQQPVDLPPDVEVLVDRIGKQTLPHDWPGWTQTYPEEPNLLRGLRSR
jgi:hypothetical protein